MSNPSPAASLRRPLPPKTPLRQGLHQLQPWQRRRMRAWAIGIALVAIIFLAIACAVMVGDRLDEQASWERHATGDQQALAQVGDLIQNGNSVEVTTGAYVEDIKELSIKDSQFRQVMLVWFSWEGTLALDMAHHFRIYDGTINDLQVVEEKEEGTTAYQLVRVDVTVSRDFRTARFPIENHVMHTYIESEYDAEAVHFAASPENQAVGDVNLAGYQLSRWNTVLTAYQYPSTFGDPSVTTGEVHSELLVNIEVSRAGWGLYLKCFIAMYGTSLWCLICLFVCARHHSDPIVLIPAALFGTVTNIMVGAAIVPDSLGVGLLEFGNMFGIGTVLACALGVIACNNIRRTELRLAKASAADDPTRCDGAEVFGRVLFCEIAFFAALGNVLLPVLAAALL